MKMPDKCTFFEDSHKNYT